MVREPRAPYLGIAIACLGSWLGACTTNFEGYRFDGLSPQDAAFDSAERASRDAAVLPMQAAQRDSSTDASAPPARDGGSVHRPTTSMESHSERLVARVDAGVQSAEDADAGPASDRGAFRTQQLGSSAEDFALGTATDGEGNVYVTGVTEAEFEGNRHAGAKDAFLVKLDPTGHTLWSRQFGTDGVDTPEGIAIGRDDNLYIVGFTNRALGGPSAGGADIFLAKYRNGERQWLRQHGSSAYDIAEALALDEAGHVYIAGRTEGDIDGNNAGVEDAFVLKYAADGALLWRRQLGTAGRDRAYAVATAPGEAGIFVAGFTTGELAERHVGGQDAYLARYDSAGQLQWVRQFGSTEHEFARSLAVDAHGDVYLAGHTAGDLGAASQGAEDLYVAKYTALGTQVWLQQFGTNAYEDMRGLVVDGAGNLYLAGTTFGVLPDQRSSGGADMLLVKLDVDGNRVWARQFGTALADEARALTLGARGGIFVVGATQGSVEGFANAGEHDVLVFAFDADGDQRSGER